MAATAKPHMATVHVAGQQQHKQQVCIHVATAYSLSLANTNTEASRITFLAARPMQPSTCQNMSTYLLHVHIE